MENNEIIKKIMEWYENYLRPAVNMDREIGILISQFNTKANNNNRLPKSDAISNVLVAGVGKGALPSADINDKANLKGDVE